MPIKRSGWGYLMEMEEEIFDLWNELGTVRLVIRSLIDQGKLNPSTDHYPSPRGVELAAKRYAIKNPETAREKIWNAGGKWVGEPGTVLPPLYMAWLVNGAMSPSALGKKKRDEFIRWANNYIQASYSQEEYDEFLAEVRHDFGDEEEESVDDEEPEFA